MSKRLPGASLTRQRDDDASVRPFAVTKVAGDRRDAMQESVAVEEPLEVRVDGRPFSVIMRTPGADDDLVAGFLFAERVAESWNDLLSIAPVTKRDGRRLHNVLDVTLNPARTARPMPLARRVTTTAACGLCGRQTIDSLAVHAPPVSAAWTLTPAQIAGLPHALRRAQALFDLTGGLHAAGLFDRDARIVTIAEDVGRHNAVDKVVGRLLRGATPPGCDVGLMVSGRTSYEIVQKAFLAGIPFVVAVSAPSSMAVDLAARGGLTLIGFARDGRFNVYTHLSRVASAEQASAPGTAS